MLDELLVIVGLILGFYSVYVLSKNNLFGTKESYLEDEVKYPTIRRKIEISKEVTRKSIKLLVGGMLLQGVALLF